MTQRQFRSWAQTVREITAAEFLALKVYGRALRSHGQRGEFRGLVDGAAVTPRGFLVQLGNVEMRKAGEAWTPLKDTGEFGAPPENVRYFEEEDGTIRIEMKFVGTLWIAPKSMPSNWDYEVQ
jgi:hypothetical protein